MKTLGEGCRKRTKGPKIEAKGRKWGKVLGTGQQAPSPPARESAAIGSLGEHCELPKGPQQVSSWSPDSPKVFHYFQHSRMASPDTIILVEDH